MRFPNDEFNKLNNDNIALDSNQESNIIILKRVKSIRQLKNSDKERVRLCYKEAILKGITIVNDIQCYIASKSKIWVERSGIEYLKRSEEEENKKWYYYLAEDHFAYVSAYRKAITSIEEYQKQLWLIMMEPVTTNTEKVHIIKELHNLTKTFTLLLRDLPFVTNLSKYYNLELANPQYNKTKELQNDQSNEHNNKVDEEIINQKVSERFEKMIDESALYTLEQKRKMGIRASTNEDEKITDPVMESMKKQLNMSPKDILDSINNKDYQESIRKIKEITEDE